MAAGLFVGIEINPAVASARQIVEGLMAKGLLSKETHDTVVRLAPPLVITREQVDWAVSRIRDVLASVGNTRLAFINLGNRFMPELTLAHVILLVGVLLTGFVFGWIYRSGRSTREKISINAGWQAQIDAQQSEHDRLAEQNKSLMEQISQYQASNKDSKMRARELSDSLKEAFERRDELQRQLKDIRGNLEVAIAQRDKLKSSADSKMSQEEATAQTLKEKADKIGRLSRALTSWQDRVPPLVERFRQRDLEAQQLEVEMQKANDRISLLESMTRGEHTRIEPVDSSRPCRADSDASNEPHGDTSVLADAALEDQIDEKPKINPAANGAVRGDEFIESSAESEAESDDEEDTERDVDDSEDDVDAVDGDEFPNVLVDDYTTGIYAPDDLQMIKGVGPAIEKTLNDLGIYRYNQIAEMSEYDIDRVAQQLKGFRSRIYREDWIGQARSLQYQKSND